MCFCVARVRRSLIRWHPKLALSRQNLWNPSSAGSHLSIMCLSVGWWFAGVQYSVCQRFLSPNCRAGRYFYADLSIQSFSLHINSNPVFLWPGDTFAKGGGLERLCGRCCGSQTLLLCNNTTYSWLFPPRYSTNLTNWMQWWSPIIDAWIQWAV